MTSTSHPLVWTKAPIAAPPLGAVAREIARVDVFSSLAESRRDWLELEAVARASPYQAFAFAEAWFLTIGAASGVELFIVMRATRPANLPSCCRSPGAGAVRSPWRPSLAAGTPILT